MLCAFFEVVDPGCPRFAQTASSTSTSTFNFSRLQPHVLTAASKRISNNFHPRPSHKRCPRLQFAFTTRCTIVQSSALTALWLHVVRLSVCVCPSLTLVDQDHIGWKSWKLIARTISPTPSLFVSQRSSIYSQGNMGKFGGDYRWGVARALKALVQRHVMGPLLTKQLKIHFVFCSYM